MALIKCPECGREISDQADACIHCGYPLKKAKPIINSNQVINDPIPPKPSVEPLDDSWMESWKNKTGRSKWILTEIFLGNLILLIVFIIIAAWHNYPSWGIVAILFLGFILIFTFSLWIAGFICIKSKSIECDGYNAIAIASIWNNYLVIENKLFEKSHNRHLDGKFPNGKIVWADFAVWDSSIKISISDKPYNEHREKNR